MAEPPGNHALLAKLRLQYQPAIHDQVQRLYANYTPSLYRRFYGDNRHRMTSFTEKIAVDIAMIADTHLSDEQVAAVAEHCNEALSDLENMKTFMIGLAGYLTYRGRKTMRFPFFTPTLRGILQTNLNPFTGGPYTLAAWHMARFGAYLGLAYVAIGPVAVPAAKLLLIARTVEDPRLPDVTPEEAWDKYIASLPQETPRTSRNRPGTIADQASFDTERGISAQARPGWNASRQSQAPVQQDSWGQDPDNTEDASPVSPDTSQDEGYDADNSGSAWDRVRNRSQGQFGQHGRQGGDAWNAASDRADRDSRGTVESLERGGNDSYTYPTSDSDKAEAKTLSQKEFDELLERERRGFDQDTNSGRRK
ncbi:hypothetical protein XA68_14237 [Ophiocordyceps unilateralis]|uniref:Uncharacterized protein n=1 Tax=Ophiocordyceps unilateralis TaxID=268505 RepID=A0A2A9PA03_OPHUN|nr:hypothetical protein XA68_14237 [Ophiocordyceps unilateralis]